MTHHLSDKNTEGFVYVGSTHIYDLVTYALCEIEQFQLGNSNYSLVNLFLSSYRTYLSMTRKENMSTFRLNKISHIYVPTIGIWLLNACLVILGTKIYVCVLRISKFASALSFDSGS